jgi:hypothetical protein
MIIPNFQSCIHTKYMNMQRIDRLCELLCKFIYGNMYLTYSMFIFSLQVVYIEYTELIAFVNLLVFYINYLCEPCYLLFKHYVMCVLNVCCVLKQKNKKKI